MVTATAGPRRWLAALVALVLAGAALAACAGGGAANGEPVSQEQAETLALVRFTNYQAGTRSFSGIVDEGGDELTVRGWVDFRDHRGYALVSAEDGVPVPVLWTGSTLFAHPPLASDETLPPLPVPDAERFDEVWSASPLSPSASSLQALFAILLQQGSDRPDNPLLIRQGGARFLGADSLDGQEVEVMTGPRPESEATTEPQEGAETSPRIRYWVTVEGDLARMEIRLGAADWRAIDFGAAGDVDLGAVWPDGAALPE